MKQIRKRLTYANVMSSLAVFLILGGATAFAAVKKIGANEIKANSIKTGKIVKEAVTQGKIKTGAVTEAKIADGAVTNKKLADNAVTSNKIADNAVTTNKIANDAVTNGKIANDAVTNGKIANGAVTTAKLSAEAQPTPVASLRVVGATGVVLSSTPGVQVLKIGTGAYCVGLPFAAQGGAVSTTGNSGSGSTAQTSVPADGNCDPHPGFQSAAVYVINNANALANENWTGIFR